MNTLSEAFKGPENVHWQETHKMVSFLYIFLTNYITTIFSYYVSLLLDVRVYSSDMYTQGRSNLPKWGSANNLHEKNPQFQEVRICTNLGSLIGNTQCGKITIFQPLRFYVKSILVILKLQKLPFGPFEKLWILNFDISSVEFFQKS